jgi:NADPH:quinone reductase
LNAIIVAGFERTHYHLQAYGTPETAMKVNAIRIHEQGGVEQMRLESIELTPPKPGEARIRHESIGVNYIDTYHRSGLYKLPMPSGIGVEGAGVVEAVGADVNDVARGDRVAYCGVIGAYAEAANVPASRLIKLPDSVSCDAAAAMLLKGLTVQYLFRQTYELRRGQTMLFHAAAGGVGLLACQWARHLGVTMIGTVSSDEKAKLAIARGCTHVINYSTEDVAKRVAELTEGMKVPVVYDGVGKDTFIASLDSLAPRGLLVSFGNASGPVTGVDLNILSAKGSLYVTRPTLATYTATTQMLRAAASELFDLVARGAITPDITRHYKLAQAQDAHRALQERGTVGSILLTP